MGVCLTYLKAQHLNMNLALILSITIALTFVSMANARAYPTNDFGTCSGRNCQKFGTVDTIYQNSGPSTDARGQTKSDINCGNANNNGCNIASGSLTEAKQGPLLVKLQLIRIR